METEGGHRGGLKGSAGHGRAEFALLPSSLPSLAEFGDFLLLFLSVPTEKLLPSPLGTKTITTCFHLPFSLQLYPLASLFSFLPRLSSTSLFSSIPLPVPSLFPALSGLLLSHLKPALSTLISAQSPALRELNISTEAPPAAT